MPINFKEGGDAGDHTTTAIEPIVNGESVNATNLNRATQNVRRRTEILADEVDNREEVSRSDRGLVCTGSSQITYDGIWDGNAPAPAEGAAGSGRLHITGAASDSISVRPAGAPNTTKFARYDQGDILFTSKKYAFQGGNKIEIEIATEAIALGTAQITMEGGSVVFDDFDGTTTLQNRIVIGVTATTTWTAVKDAVEADVTATKLVAVAIDAGKELTVASTAAVQQLSDGVDAELHTVRKDTLKTFFDKAPGGLTDGNLLKAGDSLIIGYADDLRRKQSGSGAVSADVPSTLLFNSRVYPEKVKHGIPLFVVPNYVGVDHGILLGGFRINDGVTVDVGEGAGNLAAALASTVVGGTTLVGGKALAGVNTAVTAATLEQQIIELIAAIDARLRRNGGEITGPVTVKAGGSIITDSGTPPLIGSLGNPFDGYFEDLRVTKELRISGTGSLGVIGEDVPIAYLDIANVDKLLLGANDLDDATEALATRTSVGHRAATTEYTLLWESKSTSGADDPLRLYAKSDTLVLTTNAEFYEVSPAVYAWRADNAPNVSSRHDLNGGVLTVYTKTAGASPWVDSLWSTAALTLQNGTALSSVVDSATLLTARLLMTVNTDSKQKTLLVEIDQNDGLRLYYDHTNKSFEVINNAEWYSNSGTWEWRVINIAGSDPSRCKVANDGITYTRRDASGDSPTWDDTDTGTGWESSGDLTSTLTTDILSVRDKFGFVTPQTRVINVPLALATTDGTGDTTWTYSTHNAGVNVDVSNKITKGGQGYGYATFDLPVTKNATITGIDMWVKNPTGTTGIATMAWNAYRVNNILDLDTFGKHSSFDWLTTAGAPGETVAQSVNYQKLSLTLVSSALTTVVDGYTYRVYVYIPDTNPNTVAIVISQLLVHISTSRVLV